MLREIKLYGGLAKDLGVDSLELDANSPIELMNGLRSQVKGFRQAMMDYPNLYVILADKNNENVNALTADTFQFPLNEKAEVIHLTSEIEGAGLESLIVAFLVMEGGMALATATFIASTAISMAVSFALSAVTSLLSPAPKTGGGGTAKADERPSFLYNGAINVVEQGYPVPLVYGKFLVGSVVVSAGVDVAEIAYDVEQDASPANGGGSTQPAAAEYFDPTGGAGWA